MSRIERTRFYGKRYTYATTSIPDWNERPEGAPADVRNLSVPWNCCMTGRRTKYRIGPCKRAAWFSIEVSIEDGNKKLGTRMRFPMCLHHLRSLARVLNAGDRSQ